MASLRVYRPVVAEGFEWVQPVDEADHEAVYQLDGKPRASTWKPVRVRRLRADDDGRALRPADLPWLGGHALVLGERAFRTLGGLLSEFGEFLQLDSVEDRDRLWLFNVCKSLDCLDQEASEIVRFPSTGRLMKIRNHVFRADRVPDPQVFRVPEARTLFLTGQVADAIIRDGLAGAAFELVWQAAGETAT